MKLGKLVQAQEPLAKLIQAKIPAEKAYELMLAIKKADAELKAFEETRTTKIKEYGETDEQGNTKVKDENIELFAKEINELAEKEVDVTFPKLTKEDLKGEIETAILLQLDFIFD